jgi:pimeloyl-ACP methyl ester carboxylesterase
MVAARCAVLDLDNAPLPAKWEVVPHVIIETSPGRHQCFFALEPTANFAAVEDINRRLAAYYGGDPKVCDVPHLFRVAGFKHQTGEPFEVWIKERNEFEPKSQLSDFDFLPKLPEREAANTTPNVGALDPETAELLFGPDGALDPMAFDTNEKWIELTMAIRPTPQSVGSASDRLRTKMRDFSKAAPLDPKEQHFRIPGPIDGLSLFLRFLPAAGQAEAIGRPVLYVHGATFPSALSIAHRFDGKSWRDALNEAGFDVWGLDFYGFGNSDRYPEMDQAATEHQPLCVAQDAARQVEAAARFILGHQNRDRLSLISHSWGAMPACLFATAHSARVDRFVMFAPSGRRAPRRHENPPSLPAWRIVTSEDQWNRFIEDFPEDVPPVLSRVHFEEWSRLYLDSDPESRSRDPAGVKTPLGPFSEIIKAWHGQLDHDPSQVKSPVAIVRGEWDGLVQDDDARWLFDALCNAPTKRDIRIGRGTRLMHLEAMRLALWRESIGFLQGEDVATIPS